MTLLSRLLGSLGAFLRALPARTVACLAALLRNTFAFFVALPGRAFRFFRALVVGTVGFLLALPGRTVACFGALGRHTVACVRAVVRRTVAFLRALPGRTVAFFRALPGWTAAFLRALPGATWRFVRFLPGRTFRAVTSPTAWYIYRRLVWMVFLLLVVSAIAFLIFYALPSGDPAAQRAGKGADQEQIDRVKHTLFLDRPLYEQYFHYIKQIVLHFDFGFSFDTNADVAHAITTRLPATISLAAGAAVIWLIVGVAIGILSALRPRSLFDRFAMGGALLGISAPVYWLALVALALLSKSYGVIHLIPDTGAYRPLTEDPGAWFTSLIVPWLILALSFAAIYARLMRANLLEVLDQDYIRTAEAKGLSRRRVIMRHAVRSAITPIVTAFGLDLGILLGGAVLTESVFNIPGIGRLSYDAIVANNLPVIQGTVLFAAFFIIVANIVVDILYALIDPRVRLA